jgi:hypothetical protein
MGRAPPAARRPHLRRSDARWRGLWAGGAIGREVLTAFSLAGLTPQTAAFELDAVGIVNDAVRVASPTVGSESSYHWDFAHGDPTCDQQGSLVVAIVDDLKAGSQRWSAVSCSGP